MQRRKLDLIRRKKIPCQSRPNFHILGRQEEKILQLLRTAKTLFSYYFLLLKSAVKAVHRFYLKRIKLTQQSQ